MIDFMMEKVFTLIIVVLVAMMTVLILVWLPAHMVNEKRCLDAGYPVTETTWNLDGYCITTEGVTTPEVHKLD